MGPKDSTLRRFLEKFRDACHASPRLSGVRALTTAMVFLWAQSVRIHNVSIVDIFWSISFVVNAAAYSSHKAAENAFGGRKALMHGLAIAWGARLSTYLWWRNHVSAHGIGAGGSEEDFRYQTFRRFWDKKGFSYW